MDRVIAEHLSKQYRLFRSPKERLRAAFFLNRTQGGTTFDALSDVSFSVPEGEFLGIVGRNGAGKSTLLKILAGIGTPTSGSCHIAGRRAALLELGGGFNPEFTGIQNIYFASSCMGYTRAQIDAFLPDILAFADIGDFVHQPVKTYSSGMYVRLAFAVAVNVDPDVLILDEVLAVGDIRFQQKCIRKIQDFQARGKTIVFVTHDTGAVVRFCSRALWLERGRIRELGAPDAVVRDYLAFMNQTESEQPSSASAPLSTSSPTGASSPEGRAEATNLAVLPWTDLSACESYGKRGASVESAALCLADTATPATGLLGTESLDLHIVYKATANIVRPLFGFTLKDRYGTVILEANTGVYAMPVCPLSVGERRHVRFRFTLPALRNGEFSVSIAVAEGDQTSHVQHHWVHDAIPFTIENPAPSRSLGGLVYIDGISFSEDSP